MGLYLRPQTLEEALAALDQYNTDWRSRHADRLKVIAGGTDFYPVATARQAWFEPTHQNILDISKVDILREFFPGPNGFRFGALTTWSDLISLKLPPAFDALKQAARQVGGVQIQNRGTIGGNICNASPAADGVPPLLALDAKVELASFLETTAEWLESGPVSCQMELSKFWRCNWRSNRRTHLRPDQLVKSIYVPHPMDGERSIFLKLGARAYLVISIASVAANLALDARGRIARARIAVGACSAVPQRLKSLEERLVGERPEAAGRAVEPAMLAALSPIDDIRASAAYRMDAALTLVRRALDALAEPRSAAA